MCPGCKDQPVVPGHYMCQACEDRMAGRPPPKPPRSDQASSYQGASSKSPSRCAQCGTGLENDDPFCPACGAPRPSGASARPSSARPPPQEDRTYQDPLLVNGVYRCPKCNGVLEAGIKRCGSCGVMFMHPIPDAPRASRRASAPRPDAPRPDAPRPDAPRPDAPRPDAPRPPKLLNHRRSAWKYPGWTACSI